MNSESKTLKTALAECRKRLVVEPEFQPLRSIETQLKYLIEITDGAKVDRSRLNEITIGRYAAREFETRDMSFANLLYQVEDIVSQLKHE